MYNIWKVSELSDLPVSTLRYYDKEELLPGIKRMSGIRKLGEKELERLRVIDCLKKSGLEIKDIKQFMQWCVQVNATYPERLSLFMRQKERMEKEMDRMQRRLDMIRFKCWYYNRALLDGNEDALHAMLPDHLPPEIQALYDNALGG